MSQQTSTEYWSLWYPKAASTGLWMARGLLDAVDQLLVHAAPPVMTVEVHNADGQRVAYGRDLEATQDSPICLLRKDGGAITRHDLWPEARHIGLPVLLPGSEVGILLSWWHAEDHTSWRWQLEFYNEI